MADRLAGAVAITLAMCAASPAAGVAAEGQRCTWADVEPVERRTHPVVSATLGRDFMELRLGPGKLHVLAACGRDVGLVFTGEGEIDVRDAGPLRGPLLHSSFEELPGTALIDRAVLWASDGGVQELLAQAEPRTDAPVPTGVRAVLAARQGPFDPRSDHFQAPPGSLLYAPQPDLGGLMLDVHALSLKRKRRSENLEIRSQWLSYQWSPLAAAGTGDAGFWFQRRVGSTIGSLYSAFPSERTAAEVDSAFAEERPRVPWDLLHGDIGLHILDVPGPDRDHTRVNFNVVLRLRALDGVDDIGGVLPLELEQGRQRDIGEQWAALEITDIRRVPDDGGEETSLTFDRVGDALWVRFPDEARPTAGEEMAVRVVYGGDVLKSTSTSTFAGIAGWRWYPTPPIRDRHTATLSIRAPKFWKIAATGTRIEQLLDGRMRTSTYREQRPVLRAGFLVFDGRERSTAPPAEDLPALRVFLSPRGNSPDSEIEEETYRHLRVLNELFGPFPYRELEIVELGVSGRRDVPGVISVTRYDSPPAQVMTTRAPGSSLLGALARQYVAADMGPATDHDDWLIEALALAGECRALEAAGVDQRCRSLVRGLRDEWVDSLDGRGWSSAAALRHPVVGSIWLGRQSGHDGSALIRGPLVLDSLRLLVGDDVLWGAVRRTVASYRGQGLSTRSFVLQAQAEAGRDLRSFFAWWVYTTPQLPTIRLDYTVTEEASGTFTLDGSVWVETGSTAEPLPAIVPVTLEIRLATSGSMMRRVLVTERPRPIRIEGIPVAIRKLVLDPVKAFPGRTKVAEAD